MNEQTVISQIVGTWDKPNLVLRLPRRLWARRAGPAAVRIPGTARCRAPVPAADAPLPPHRAGDAALRPSPAGPVVHAQRRRFPFRVTSHLLPGRRWRARLWWWSSTGGRHGECRHHSLSRRGRAPRSCFPRPWGLGGERPRAGRCPCAAPAGLARMGGEAGARCPFLGGGGGPGGVSEALPGALGNSPSVFSLSGSERGKGHVSTAGAAPHPRGGTRPVGWRGFRQYPFREQAR